MLPELKCLISGGCGFFVNLIEHILNNNPEACIELKWLISGGCGFIGVNLIEHILNNNPEACIRVIDNLTGGTREDLQEVTDFREVSLIDMKSVKIKNIMSSSNPVILFYLLFNKFYTSFNIYTAISRT